MNIVPTYKREKSPISIQQEKIKKAENIFSEFKQFTSGYRLLFLIHRNKEGGETNNTKVKKIITRNEQEFFDALVELVDEQMSSDIPYRIYSSVNPRNFGKAVRQFKFEQLDADYNGALENFYLDLKNRFIGCLMQPAQRDGNYFLFDIDNVDGVSDVHGEFLNAIKDFSDLIVTQYRTKNGWHVVTLPFNHTKIQLPSNVEFKKDGLLLLSY